MMVGLVGCYDVRRMGEVNPRRSGLARKRTMITNKQLKQTAGTQIPTGSGVSTFEVVVKQTAEGWSR